MGSLLIEIVIDCREPATLARWWGQVLGWPVTDDPRGLSWVSRTGSYDPPVLVFVPVPEPKTVKNRIHVDVGPIGCEQGEELQRLLDLGAKPVDVGQQDAPWVVLSDPEGNEFCLLGRRADALVPSSAG